MHPRNLLVLIVALSCTETFAQTSIWSAATAPANLQASDTGSVTLGLRFSSDVPGVVTGIRYYKAAGNTGTHTGNLWSSTGTQLATVTFAGESASGWQQASFSSPVAIVANTTYVVSYTAPRGGYSSISPMIGLKLCHRLYGRRQAQLVCSPITQHRYFPIRHGITQTTGLTLCFPGPRRLLLPCQPLFSRYPAVLACQALRRTLWRCFVLDYG